MSRRGPLSLADALAEAFPELARASEPRGFPASPRRSEEPSQAGAVCQLPCPGLARDSAPFARLPRGSRPAAGGRSGGLRSKPVEIIYRRPRRAPLQGAGWPR